METQNKTKEALVSYSISKFGFNENSHLNFKERKDGSFQFTIGMDYSNESLFPARKVLNIDTQYQCLALLINKEIKVGENTIICCSSYIKKIEDLSNLTHQELTEYVKNGVLDVENYLSENSSVIEEHCNKIGEMVANNEAKAVQEDIIAMINTHTGEIMQEGISSSYMDINGANQHI